MSEESEQIINTMYKKVGEMKAIAKGGTFDGEVGNVMKEALEHIVEMIHNNLGKELADETHGDPACIANYLKGKLGNYNKDSKETKLIEEYIKLAEEIKEQAKKLV